MLTIVSRSLPMYLSTNTTTILLQVIYLVVPLSTRRPQGRPVPRRLMGRLYLIDGCRRFLVDSQTPEPASLFARYLYMAGREEAHQVLPFHIVVKGEACVVLVPEVTMDELVHYPGHGPVEASN